MTIDIDGGELVATFVAHRGPLRRAALAIVGTPEAADDVVQDAYVKLVAAAISPDVRQPLGYCFQVVRNMALDHRRRRALEADLLTIEDDGRDVPTRHGLPEQQAISRQNLDIVAQVLAGLPARTRRVFELYHLGGHTQRTIATQLGVSVGLVNGMLRDVTVALTRCRPMLDRD